MVTTDSELIALYRGWQSLESQLNGVDVIDFDLTATTDHHSFTSRHEVLLALENAARSLTVNNATSEFNYARLKASIYYLNACLGEQIPFFDYAETTMGVRPEKFSEVLLLESYDRADALLQEIGLKFCPNYRAEYEATCLMQDKTAVKTAIHQHLAKWQQRLGQYIDLPELKSVSVSFAEVDAYWSNWVSGSVCDGFNLRVNLHPRIKYLKGTPSLLAAHEYCGHLIQVQQWALNLADRTISPSYGFTTVHTPETFLMEGIADVLVYILADETELDFDEQLARQLTWHSRLVGNNAHYLINTGHPFRDVFAYCRKYLPFADDRAIESSIRDRSCNPLGRTYQYVYGIALDYFRRYFEGRPDRIATVLPDLYQRPYTKRQLDRLFESLPYIGSQRISSRNPSGS